jgi:hypothetical protein
MPADPRFVYHVLLLKGRRSGGVALGFLLETRLKTPKPGPEKESSFCQFQKATA